MSSLKSTTFSLNKEFKDLAGNGSNEHLCESLNKNDIDMYLQSLGIKKENTAKMRQKCPKLEIINSRDCIESVIEFLKGELNIPEKKLCSVITKCPKLLVYNVNEKLLPAIACLLGTGINNSQLRSLVINFPEILTRSSEEKLCPLLSFFLSIGVPESKLPHILCSYPRIISFKIEEKFVTTLSYLLKLGVQKQDIAKGVVRFPQLLAYNLENKLKPSIHYLQNIGFEEEHFCRVVAKFPNVLCRNPDKSYKPSIEFLHSRLSKTQVLSMVTVYPPILVKNVSLLKQKIDYLENDMKLSLQETVYFPQYFGFSLFKKIIRMHKNFYSNGGVYNLRAIFNSKKKVIT